MTDDERMMSSQMVVSEIVSAWLKESGWTQAALASELSIEQSGLSKKLHGVRCWSLDDLDRLVLVGVPIVSPASVAA